jgi:hypothetical protein
MSFPWIAEAQRRKQQEDEAFAARAVAEFTQKYRDHLNRINRATDSEIDAAMADILRRQRDVKTLRPGRRSRDGFSALAEFFKTGNVRTSSH